MFKNILNSISKSLSGKPAAPAPAATTAAAIAKGKAAAPAPAATKAEAKAEAAKEKLAPVIKDTPAKTPEELCGIEPKMNKEQIRDQLKLLYRRHNRAASSLDAKTRKEADGMLDAIVAVREKTFGEI